VFTRLFAFLFCAGLLAGCTTTEGGLPPAAQPGAAAALLLPYAADGTWSPWIEADHGEIRRVATADRCVALTFDDGPHPSMTPRLLAILAEENVTATFFVVGQRVATWPTIVKAIADGGHEIGNHSWSHPNLTSLASEDVLWQISATDAAIMAAAGIRPGVIRFPYDASSPRILALVDRPVVFWDIDTLDWQNKTADEMVQIATGRARPGSIILMHDIHANTIAAVRGIIRGLRARGFEFVTVSTLISGQACHQPQLAGT
jgi:peptidoglycan/xylan/chitin deacetylase (PgdA/CDA1 family)